MSSVSLLIATNGMATDQQINMLVVQLLLVITFFLCERWNNFDNHFSIILL